MKLLRNSQSRFDFILTERCLPDIDEFKFFGALGKITDLPPVIGTHAACLVQFNMIFKFPFHKFTAYVILCFKRG